VAFKRSELPTEYLTGDALTEDMIGIGMLFGGTPSENPQIEQTLVAASIEGIMGHDGRVISVLTDWITIHHERIYMDRLYQLLRELDPVRFNPVLIYWAANAQRLKKDPRFSKIAKIYHGPRVNYERIGSMNDTTTYDATDFLIQRNGEDDRFLGTCLRVPNKTIRHRLDDVLPPKRLALQHDVYRYRVLFGANIRADLWATLKKMPDTSPADLARECLSSYTAAYTAKKDFEFIRSLRKPKRSKAA